MHVPQLALRVNVTALRSLRLGLALTQHELARKAGVSRVTVSRLEQGAPASCHSVRQLADALGVDIAAIATVGTASEVTA